MKVSNKHTEKYLHLNDEDEGLIRLQQGGRIPLVDIQNYNTQLPSKQDNTKRNPVKLSGIGQQDYSRDQGTISAYDKSPREKLMSSLYKVSNTGNGALTGLIASPVISGAKLLRPDKYFKGVDSDAKLGDALLSMGGDILNAAPLVPAGGKALKLLGSEARQVGRATKDAFSYTTNAAKKAYAATDGIDQAKRIDNAMLAGATSKRREADLMEHAYFEMDEAAVAKAMASDKKLAPRGAIIGDDSMSYNSAPLYWNGAARAEGRGFKTVQTGEHQWVNRNGYKGKRVEAAFTKESKPLLDYFKEARDQGVKDIDDLVNAKVLDEGRRAYQTELLNPNRRMLEKYFQPDGEHFDHAAAFLENYKPVMDKGIWAVNSETGLNFPRTSIHGLNGKDIDGLMYSQPSAVTIKGGGKTRIAQTVASNIRDIPRHYLINKLEAKVGNSNPLNNLRHRIQRRDISSESWNDNWNYLKSQTKNKKTEMSIDDLVKNYEEQGADF